MSRRLASIALVFACLGLVGCMDSCAGCGEAPIATMLAKDGRVDASRAAARARWNSAAVGTEFRLDDAVRTGRRATARLRLDDGNTLDVRPETTIRFASSRPGERTRRLDVVEGEAMLTLDEATSLEMGRGIVHVARGSQLRLTREGGELVLVVTMGSARLELEGTADVAIPAGGSVAATASGEVRASATPRRADDASGARPNASGTGTSEDSGNADSVTAVLVGEHQVQAPGADVFATLASGTHRLAPGTRIRQSGGSVELRRGQDQLVIRGATEFAIGNGRQLVTSLHGTPTFESSSDGVAIVTPGGVLITRPVGGRTIARLTRDAERRVALEVERGAFDVARGEETTRVAAGESLALGVDDGTDTAADAAAAVDEGPSCLADHMDLELGAGDGVVVRDPNPPTAIGIGTATLCPGGAIVELLGSGTRVLASARGQGTIPVLFPEGSPNYRVRCVVDGAPAEAVAARGRLRILHTSGQAPLPRTAPESRVDADGRTYQVVYSNRLPAITVRWPSGPDSAGTLVVSGAGGMRRVAVSGPRHRFASGAFGEGTHRVHFEAGGRRSRDTTITIRFDPAAASASLESPTDGTIVAGQTVHVSGFALNGWQASCAGTAMPVGGDQRFGGECVVPSSGVLVVRLSKPGQGVHLYLRRARGGA